mmetsp:Transcript_10271/g.28309  ORF Transcript_10271/g.28309 Transcript_10271/m.28309 type:complete len:369 (-) Transcript_10271:84-1190(-)|eukprot:CAMPEP_0168722776 /NCGR_PEP_ID=MMETSP0724-20121128/2771_1 /TAXON_ID=265536 /ORGANISM="Amphiprora sp., Strain CCMP467" /LENGTH=368 /DNA_ID=CAMNT_0008769457 /DNA_START=87 /DNA_END=1193 /DNA_ORIENTATION=-
MQIRLSTATLLAALLLAPATAFAPARTSSLRTHASSSSFRLKSTAAEDEIAKLRAAAAKAREEANKLSQELGKDDTTTAMTAPKKSMDEFKAMLPSLVAEPDLAKQAEIWSDLKASNSVQSFGQAVLRTFPVSLEMLESRTGMSAESMGLEMTNVSLDDFKYATLYVLGFSSIAGVGSLALLPPNVGATFCYLFALLPILFLGLGSSAPELIANVIASIKGEKGDSVSPQERICRHEAAHFCCGYWCGLPITGYSVLDGVARVEFGVSGNKFSSTEVAALSITALSGLVGEAMQWGTAEGAQNDLMQLEGVFRQSEEFIRSGDQQDITRWGAFTASQLLKNNADKYEKVVEAFSRQASAEECILILES